MNAQREGTETPLYRYRFSNAEFDEARFELRVEGLVVELERKPLEVLALLLRHPGEVVTREELLESVWAGRITVDNVLPNAIAKLRKALGEIAADCIQTQPRVGYRIAGGIERVAVGRKLVSRMNLSIGQTVPGRDHFTLLRQLGSSRSNEVWLARHDKTGELRVYKFSLDGERLGMLKREATLSRLLREGLGERNDFARVIDWNFETAPFFLECAYGGENLAQWNEAGHLGGMSAQERLELFLQIADAIGAAHSLGVLHKDLKPANVLIAPQNPGWQVQITDFGSGRLLEPERLAELGITQLGLTMTASASTTGTPLYIAPEIISGSTPTVQSDVYSLGLLLYQLLAADLKRPMAPGWEDEIENELLREDIAAATRGNPMQRLSSAAELAERLRQIDRRALERSREHDMARRAEQAERRLERSRARQPWLIASALTLVIGLIASSLLYRQADLARREAQSQAMHAEAVNRFLNDDILGGPYLLAGSVGENPTLLELLDHASLRIDDRFADDALTRAGIHSTLSAAYLSLGKYESAERHSRASIDAYISTGNVPGADLRLLRERYGLVRIISWQTRFEEAKSLLDQTDDEARAYLEGDTEPALRSAIAHAAWFNQQLQYKRALIHYQRANHLQRALRPDDAIMAAFIRSGLAESLQRLGRIAEAEAAYGDLLTDPLLGADRVGPRMQANYRRGLAITLRSQGRYEEALPLAVQAVESLEHELGPDHYSTIVALSTLASIRAELDQCEPTLDAARSVYERMSRAYGSNHQATLTELGNLGYFQAECGQRKEALDTVAEAIQGLRKQHGIDNVAAKSFRVLQARLLLEENRAAEAWAVAIDLDSNGAIPTSARGEHRLAALRGRILIAMGHVSEGTTMLADAIAALESMEVDEEILRPLREVLPPH